MTYGEKCFIPALHIYFMYKSGNPDETWAEFIRTIKTLLNMSTSSLFNLYLFSDIAQMCIVYITLFSLQELKLNKLHGALKKSDTAKISQSYLSHSNTLDQGLEKNKPLNNTGKHVVFIFV